MVWFKCTPSIEQKCQVRKLSWCYNTLRHERWTDKLPQRTDCPYGQIAPSQKTPLRTDCPIEKCPKDRLPHRKMPLRTDRIWIFAPSPCSCWYHRLKPKILPHLNEYIEYIITSVLASLTRSKWSLCFIYGGRSLVNAMQGSAVRQGHKFLRFIAYTCIFPKLISILEINPRTTRVLYY